MKKLILPLLLMWICTLTGAAGYRLGFVTHIAICLMSIVLTFIGYKLTKQPWELLVVYADLLLSVYIGSALSTRLYYNNISPDDMSIVLGGYFTMLSMGITAVIMLVFFLISCNKNN